jgi:hypothetical protein
MCEQSAFSNAYLDRQDEGNELERWGNAVAAELLC